MGKTQESPARMLVHLDLGSIQFLGSCFDAIRSGEPQWPWMVTGNTPSHAWIHYLSDTITVISVEGLPSGHETWLAWLAVKPP